MTAEPVPVPPAVAPAFEALAQEAAEHDGPSANRWADALPEERPVYLADAAAFRAGADASARRAGFDGAADYISAGERRDRGNDASQDHGPAGKESAADRLVSLAMTRYDLGRADDGEPFAVERDGPNVARMFRGGRASLRSALAAAYAAEHGKVPPAQGLVDALAVLEGRALTEPRQPLPLRAARLPHGAILLDIGDETGRVVRVDVTGWRILDRSPIAFRRSELTAPIPTPTYGDLAALVALVNMGADDLSCALAQIIGALLGLPVPLVYLRGPAGAAKSSGARILGSIADPSPAPLRAAPRDLEAWAVAAAGSLVVALDNLDSVPAWLSDALCRAVTGEAIVRRALYTDSGLSVLAFRRAVILTAIDAGAVRGDLADRLLAVDLAPIPDDRRREDREMVRAFDAAHPAILGAFLDLVADVLRRLPVIELDRLPRMADYARVLAAVDGARGTDGLARYLDQRGELQRDAAEGDRVGAVLIAWSAGRLPWTGTATDLHAGITPERPPKGWPESGRALAGALRRLAQPLAAAGIAVTFHRSGHDRARTIRLDHADDADTNPPPDPSRKVDTGATSAPSGQEGTAESSSASSAQPDPSTNRADDMRTMGADADANRPARLADRPHIGLLPEHDADDADDADGPRPGSRGGPLPWLSPCCDYRAHQAEHVIRGGHAVCLTCSPGPIA